MAYLTGSRGRAWAWAALLGAVFWLGPQGAFAQGCVGDCNANREVTIDELIRAVNVALGNAALSQCTAIDRNANGAVTIDELIAAVNAALSGCPPAATATATAATATPSRSATPTATRTVIPGSIVVRITSPAPLTLTNQSPITVSGDAIGSAVQVVVNGVAATVAGGRFTATGVALVEGGNVITAVATDALDQSVTDSITVSLDTTPPRVVIEAPAAGARTAEAAVPVAGMVNDIITGIVGSEDVAVTVNGVDADLAAGSFVASGVPLSLGPNTLTARAVDAAGNLGTASVTLTRLADAVAASLVHVSGNEQQAAPGSTLAPLIVRLRDVVGNGLAGRTVRFRVTRGDGRFADGAREIEVTTAADGRATATYTLGSRAGVGLHRVEADAPDGDGVVVFCESATVGAPTQLHVQSGDRQRAPAGDAVPEPFVVIARDAAGNPVADATVTFSRDSGTGTFGGQASRSVTTDANGRAAAHYTTGAAGADTEERVAARLSGGGDAALFTVTAIVPGDPASTIFSGIVLDNTNRPLRSTRLFIAGATPPIEAVADVQGRFRFAVPPGPFDLDVVGPNSVQTGGGDFPGLRFNAFAVAGRDNSLPEPIYLPLVDKANELIAGGATDVDVPIDGIEGARLRVFANSVRRANGNRTAPVSASQVSQDKVPMPFPGGVAPPLVLTIQPADARFDPPAQLVLPNLDGKPPGFIQNLLSFDHDREEYVIVGTATVSEDGSEVVTDRGFGVIKGGWHGSPTDPERPGFIDGFVGPVNPNNGDPGPDPSKPPRPNNGSNPDGPNRDGTRDPAPGGEGGPSSGPGPGPGPGPSPGGGGGGGDPTRPTTHTGGDAIVMATGELIIEAVDLDIPGRGFSFQLRRTYRSQFNADGPLGHNWDFIYFDQLMLPEAGAADDDILRCNGATRVDRYEKQPDGSFAAPPGSYNGLRRNPDGTYTIRARDGFRRTYNANGRLARLADRHGNTMTFTYNGAGQLTVVTDTMGRDIRFVYNSVGRLATVTDFIGREVQYRYDSRGDLVAVRSPVVVGTSTGNDFPEGKLTRYAYASGFNAATNPRLEFANHNLLSITDPKGQVYLVNTYNNDPDSYQFDRVVRQQEGRADQVSTYAYSELNAGQDDNDPNRPRNQTVEVDRNGNRRVFIHNGQANLLESRYETNRNVNPDDPDTFVFRYTYNANNEVLTATFPEGNREEYTYDSSGDPAARGNLLALTRVPGPRGADQNQLRVTYRYEPIYQQHRATTDPRGNDASFVPPNGGANSAARYTSTSTFDYQEGNTLAALATELGRPASEVSTLLAAAGMSLNLGDQNGDGVTDRIAGDGVRRDASSVRLLPDSVQAQTEGGTTQAIISTYTYNRYGQPLSAVDPEGNVTDYEYFPESDPDGDGIASPSRRTLDQQTGGYLAQVVTDARTSPRRRETAPPAAISSELAYDEVGNLIRTTDARGFTSSMERNALNQIVRVTGDAPFNYERRAIYDANDNLVREEIQNVDTNGPDLDDAVTTTMEYDVLDFVTLTRREVSTQEALETRQAYDANQNLIRTTYPEGNAVTQAYDERNRLFRETYGDGTAEAATFLYTYDGNGNLARKRDAEDNNGDGQPEVMRWTYDGYDRPLRKIDAAGNETRLAYDPASNEIRTRRFGHPGGPTPADATGGTNVLLAENEARFDELNRDYQRDALLFANGVPAGTDGPLTPGDGKVTARMEFDRIGRLTRMIDDNLHASRTEYDGVNRRVLHVDHLGNSMRATYDDNGNLLETVETTRSPGALVDDETFRRAYTYDALDRRVAAEDNLGNVTTFGYDSRNNLIRQRDALGNVTEFVFDGLNRRVATRYELRASGIGSGPLDTGNPANADGLIVTRYDWDRNSRLASFTDDRGNATTFQYDALNRRTLTRMADQTEIRSAYDRDSHLTRNTDPNGSVLVRTFDAIDRVVAVDVTRGAGVAGTTARRLQYDGLSRLARVTENNDPGATADDSEVTSVHDSLSRLLRDVQNGLVVSAGYDGFGNRTSVGYPNGRTLSLRYDGLNLLEHITDAGADVVRYDYTGAGRILERRYGNGTRLRMHDGAGNDVGYDGRKRIVQLRHETMAGAPIAELGYGFDQVSNRRFEHDRLRDRANVYQFDSAYRVQRSTLDVPGSALQGLENNAIDNADLTALPGAESQAWTFDGVGNWATQQIDSSTRTFAVDALNAYRQVAGQQRQYDANGNLVNDGARRYAWDAFNRLVRVSTAAGAEIASYAYDGLGRRLRTSAGGQVTTFVWDGLRTIEERDGGGAVLRQYVWGRGLDELVQVRAGGNDRYLHESSLGSIVAATDAAGAVVERYRYEPYGTTTVLAPDGVTVRPASSIGNPYRFTAQRLDAETGLFYLRSRYYDADVGRFLSRDPAGFADGPGQYEYAGGNPVNMIDPLGTEKQCPGGGCPPETTPSGPGFAPYYASNWLDAKMQGFDADVEWMKEMMTSEDPGLAGTLWNTFAWSSMDLGSGLAHSPSEMMKFGSEAGYEHGQTGSISATTLATEAGRGGGIVLSVAGTGGVQRANTSARAARGPAKPSGGSLSSRPSGPTAADPPPPPDMAGMNGGDILANAPEPHLAMTGRVAREMKQASKAPGHHSGQFAKMADDLLTGKSQLEFLDDARFDARVREMHPNMSPAEIDNAAGMQVGKRAYVRSSLRDPVPSAVHELTHIYQEAKGLLGTFAREAHAYFTERAFNRLTGRRADTAGQCAGRIGWSSRMAGK